MNETLDINVPKKIHERKQRIASAKTPIPPSPSSSPVRNFVQELAELTKLFREKALTQDEFTLAKEKLLQ